MRINLLAGPGAGKSTTSAWLFSELKVKNVSVELITEYVKTWAIQKRKVTTFDQVYLFGKQMQYEYQFLNNGVKNVVTDSPLILSCVYADYYYPEMQLGQHLLEIMHKYEVQYPSLNIYLERKDKPYNQDGRYQSYEEAKKVDQLVKDVVYEYLPNVYCIDYNDRTTILNLALKNVN